ncbi:MAG: hypothetical protein NT020_08855, partial [Chloroflexales bacterium]|nr:hypothetical protein [Chloroflexales bacterium]
VIVEIRDAPADFVLRVSPAIIMIEVIVSPGAIQRGSVNKIRAEVSVGTWDDGNTMRQVQLTIPADIRLMSNIPVAQLIRNSVTISISSTIVPSVIVATTPVATGTVAPTPVITLTPVPVATGTVIATVTKIDN